MHTTAAPEERRRRVALCTLLTVLSLLTSACGTGGASGERGQSKHGSEPNPVTFGPGRLVSIGAGRSLYLVCRGTGSPTVILEAGLSSASESWSEVQPALARTTRTCSYDRAGLGNSSPMPAVHDAADAISDLARLVHRAGIRPPYVLVGHSYGGLLVRLFAHAHPGWTAGVVLADAMGHNLDRRLLRIWRAQPASVRRQVPRPGANSVQDGVDILAGEALDAKVTSLGSAPLIVITRGRLDDDGSGVTLPASLRRAVDTLWVTMQAELAALSSDTIHIIALHSGHTVVRSTGGQPGVVIAAVRAVIHAARSHSRLPACVRQFHAPGIRCLP